MAYDGYRTLDFKFDCGVLIVTIDTPPINLMTMDMVEDIKRFTKEVSADKRIKVIVFKSANKDYFIAHYDISVLEKFPEEPPPKPKQLSDFGGALMAFREMPIVSIAQIEGRARGGGSEFALALDMRFGVYGRTILSQPEIAVSLIPGAGGTQRLPKLIGRARALEVILGGLDCTADIAERYGYLNRAMGVDEIGPFVERLAYQIASYNSEAIALIKRSVLNAENMPLTEGLLEETYMFGQLASKPDAKLRMKKMFEAGAQTFKGELDFNELLRKLYE
jgi:enoyl-CoA hydratase/carnithine racemase